MGTPGKMVSYKALYHYLLGSMDDALTKLENGDVIQAIRVLEKSIRTAEESVVEVDIFPETEEENTPSRVIFLPEKKA